MIPLNATLTLQHISPAELVIDDADHVDPVEPWAVRHYERLLTEQPDYTTDPVLVFIGADGRKRVRRGRHRVLANRNVDRPFVLCIVMHENGETHE